MLHKRGGTVNKIVVWSLFDSGIGSYQKTIRKFFPNIKNYSIGIDKLHKNDDFINLDLADFHKLFGDNKMFDTLDNLPKPNIILASPPCESWSVASAMRGEQMLDLGVWRVDT